MKIRITKTPPGFAPEAIRQAWVGVELEALPPAQAQELEKQFDPTSDSVGGYIVSGSDAVAALATSGKKEAAEFWCRPMPPSHLRFARNCCEVI